MMRWLILAVVLAAPAALACTNSMNEYDQPEGPYMSESDKLLHKATYEFAHGMYRKALSNAEDALEAMRKEHQRDASGLERAHLLAGEAALKLEKWEKAEQHLSAYGTDAKAKPHLRARLAEARLGNDELGEGAAVLEELAKEDLMPDGQAWAALMNARAAKGDEPGAAIAARTALERDPGNKAAKYFLYPDQRPASPAPMAGALGVGFLGLSLVLAKRRGWILARARA